MSPTKKTLQPVVSAAEPLSPPALLDALIPALLRIRNRRGDLVWLIPNQVQRRFARRSTATPGCATLLSPTGTLACALASSAAAADSRRNIILKARQMGITTYIAARFFLKTILRPGTLTLQVAHSLESAQQIFRIVHRFLAHLHPQLALRHGVYPGAAGATSPRSLPRRSRGHFPTSSPALPSRATLRELAFGAIDSRYLVDTAGNPHAGRGLTIHNLHVSELALWPARGTPTLGCAGRSARASETFAGLLAAVPPHGEVAIESTPRGVGDFFHSLWSSSSLSSPGLGTPSPLSPPDASGRLFTPHFFPWWLEPAYQLPLQPGELVAHPLLGVHLHNLDTEERALLAREGLTPAQIKFRRFLRATYGDLAPQEFAESDTQCFLSTGRPVFDLPAIDARMSKLPQPIRIAQNGAECVWFDPLPGRSYIIAADVAEGGAHGDFSAAVVIEAELGLQCAEILARWPIHRFALELARLGHQYNCAWIAVERNNQGHAVLYALQHEHAYNNLYRHLPSPLSSPGLGTTKPGWPMNVQTKPEAIHRLVRLLREEPGLFTSRRLLEQCRSYVYLDGGEMGALPGMHDDLVIAAAIACAVRARGAGVQFRAVPL